MPACREARNESSRFGPMFDGGLPEAASVWQLEQRLANCRLAGVDVGGVGAAAAARGDQEPPADGEGGRGAAGAPETGRRS